jgi:hypothetical protein
MSKQFTHLVWLGAGTAHEPKGLLATADYVTLVDARESACTLLAPLSSEKISVKQILLTSDGVDHEFTEYNLAEFSSIQPIDGLKNLFPGIKAVKSESIKSTKITNFVEGLELNDQNNMLVVDIPDINLMLLNALHEGGLLSNFCELHVQTSRIPLYTNGATHKDIIEFLEKVGYVLSDTTGDDPDLPWLCFIVNPLWTTLQLALSSKQALLQELSYIKQQSEEAAAQHSSAASDYQKRLQELELERDQLTAKNKEEIASLNKSLFETEAQTTELKLQQDELKSANEQLNARINEHKTELAEKLELHRAAEQQLQISIEKYRTEALQAQDVIATHQETIMKLEKNNRALLDERQKLREQQQNLKSELIKVEAQMDLIKHLFLISE